jgi:hypothetical protein
MDITSAPAPPPPAEAIAAKIPSWREIALNLIAVPIAVIEFPDNVRGSAHAAEWPRVVSAPVSPAAICLTPFR